MDYRTSICGCPPPDRRGRRCLRELINLVLHYSEIGWFFFQTLLWRHNGRVHPGADQRKHQGSASLAFVRGIHRRPVNSPHKWPVTRKMFPFDDVVMNRQILFFLFHLGLAAHSSPTPRDAYMRRWTGWAVDQLMAWHLVGVKPLPEPMGTFSQLDPWEQTSVKFESKYKAFHFWKCVWSCRLRNSSHFV